MTPDMTAEMMRQLLREALLLAMPVLLAVQREGRSKVEGDRLTGRNRRAVGRRLPFAVVDQRELARLPRLTNETSVMRRCAGNDHRVVRGASDSDLIRSKSHLRKLLNE